MRKSYSRNKVILPDVSLSVQEQEILFLLGPSGCGKSTLLRIIAGLLDVDAGEIILNGKLINDQSPEKGELQWFFKIMRCGHI